MGCGVYRSCSPGTKIPSRGSPAKGLGLVAPRDKHKWYEDPQLWVIGSIRIVIRYAYYLTCSGM